MASAQPTTIPDPSSNPASGTSDHVMVIVLTTLLSTGVLCIACACYINIRRRNRLLQQCNHAAVNNGTSNRDLEAGDQQAPAAMAERSRTGGRRYFPTFRRDGSISQTALTGPGAAPSIRSGSALDRRSSLNSSMFDGYARSPAGSTFGTQVHRGRDNHEDGAGRGRRRDDGDEDGGEESLPEPPPRYETAVQQPPAVEVDITDVPTLAVHGEEHASEETAAATTSSDHEER